jgi:hypothetical protein
MPLYRRVVVFWFYLRYVLNSNTSLSMYLLCNSRIHVITLCSAMHVYIIRHYFGVDTSYES